MFRVCSHSPCLPLLTHNLRGNRACLFPVGPGPEHNWSSISGRSLLPPVAWEVGREVSGSPGCIQQIHEAGNAVVRVQATKPLFSKEINNSPHTIRAGKGCGGHPPNALTIQVDRSRHGNVEGRTMLGLSSRRLVCAALPAVGTGLTHVEHLLRARHNTWPGHVSSHSGLTPDP